MIANEISAARILLTASAIALLGMLWDLSWHATLAEMAPYAPAHLALAVVGAMVAAAIAAKLRGHRTERAKATRRINVFATLALLAGATAGLAFDPTIYPGVSLVDPAHILLAVGVVALSIGSLLAWGGDSKQCILYGPVAIGFAMASVLALAVDQLGPPNLWRGAGFYQTSCAIIPALLVTSASGWPRGGSATISAAAYTAAMLTAIWLLPLSDAIGASHQRLISPFFPLCVLPAAVAIDFLFWIWLKPAVMEIARSAISTCLTSILVGTAFFVVIVPVHWMAGPWLVSPLAHATLYLESPWPERLAAGDWRFELWSIDSGRLDFVAGLVVALSLAVLSSGAGFVLGRWLRETSSPEEVYSA